MTIKRDKDGQLINITSSESSVVEENINKEPNAQRKWTFEDWKENEDVFTLCKQFVSKLEAALNEAKEMMNK